MTHSSYNQICSRCVMDTTVQSIRFDDHGVCNFCKSHDILIAHYPQESNARNAALAKIVERIKRAGRRKRYDCIVGLSGGTDSTYTLYLAKQLGLRPLAVHFDNGWSSDISVSNIKNATEALSVDLYTYVVDWEEFKSLQVAFLKAAVPCIDIPADVAITGTLFRLAVQEGVKFILNGASFITEGTVPIEWSYIDGTYVRSVNKLFGTSRLRTYPNATIYDILYYTFFKGILTVPFLNYTDYDKVTARSLLERDLGWKYYGGHHYENVYSHFAFGWYLPNKFGIDKRKVSLSGPIRMGCMKREEALEQLRQKPPVTQETVEYCVKKLGLTPQDFAAIMALPPKYFWNYRTSYQILNRFRYFVKWAVQMNLIAPVVYEKYLSENYTALRRERRLA